MVNLLGNNVARRRPRAIRLLHASITSRQLFRLEDRSKLQTTYANLQFN
jgi:hypothetical protein